MALNYAEEDLDSKIRALIQALKADLHAALNTADESEVAAALRRAREVELPERRLADEWLCNRRLQTALASQDEATMRSALSMARNLGLEHIPIFPTVLAKQQTLYRDQLTLRLQTELELATYEDDFVTLVAVNRTAKKHNLSMYADKAKANAEEMVLKFRTKLDFDKLTAFHQDAKKWQVGGVAGASRNSHRRSQHAKGLAGGCCCR